MAARLVTLNIGLACPTFLMPASQTRHTLASRQVMAGRLMPNFMEVRQIKQVIVPRHVYGGEPVLVVSALYEPERYDRYLFDLLVAMEQDCCAILCHATDEGALFGPHADKWGTFNRNYFVM
jgi:hypothetical protein